jgi:hypothetical protein
MITRFTEPLADHSPPLSETDPHIPALNSYFDVLYADTSVATER